MTLLLDVVNLGNGVRNSEARGRTILTAIPGNKGAGGGAGRGGGVCGWVGANYLSLGARGTQVQNISSMGIGRGYQSFMFGAGRGGGT